MTLGETFPHRCGPPCGCGSHVVPSDDPPSHTWQKWKRTRVLPDQLPRRSYLRTNLAQTGIRSKLVLPLLIQCTSQVRSGGGRLIYRRSEKSSSAWLADRLS